MQRSKIMLQGFTLIKYQSLYTNLVRYVLCMFKHDGQKLEFLILYRELYYK